MNKQFLTHRIKRKLSKALENTHTNENAQKLNAIKILSHSENEKKTREKREHTMTTSSETEFSSFQQRRRKIEKEVISH